jgi:transporter family-2 protein
MFPFLAFIVGILTAAQSRINGQLSHVLSNGLMAAIVSFGSGLIILSIVNFASARKRTALNRVVSAVKFGSLKPWQVIGGMGGGFYVAVQSISVPQLGVALFSITAIGGQTFASLLVDKFGISPRGKQAISPVRVFIAITILIAVTISVYPDLGKASFKFLPVILGLVVGCIVSFQQAINGQVNEVSQEPLSTALINFIMGTFVLVIALGVNLLTGAHINPFPHTWWLYLGGLCGIAFIAVSAHVVKHLGILNFILFSVAGQLVAAVFIDWVFPSPNAKLTGYLISGTALTLLAVASSRIFTQDKKAVAS